MGARVHGDTLWVLDVDVLRGFSTRTGAQLAAVDLSPLQALFLNDLALDPAGGFYITDTGVRMSPDGKPGAPGPNRIYHVDRDHRITVALETPALALPDGIDWDARAHRYVLGPFGGKAVQEWHPGDPAPVDVAPGKGRFDGVEAQADGSLLVTSWNDSTVSVLEDRRLVHRLGPLTMTPADVSLDARRGRVGVVSLEANRFELWPWPRQ
jgi:sugar lactone lactonase YvrE